MAVKGTELIKFMNTYAPPIFAIENDPIGLQVGDLEAEVKGILVTLEVTEEVVDEAIRRGTNWIISHHAVIYKPLKAIRTDQRAGRIYAKLLQHDINVYIAHTNLDVAENGVNDVLAEKLDLQEIEILIPSRQENIKKLIVFVPEDHHEQVLQAMGNAGAGWIGNYSHCTFNTKGMGTFLPHVGTDPFIGQQGKLERVDEVRLETIVTESNERQVVEAMLRAHPYEEVAYDIYPLELKGKTYGFGRIGMLKQSMTLIDFANMVKQMYKLKGLRIVGDPQKQVKKVALLGGSGGRFIADAKRMGADVYITGDIGHHEALDALASGLCLIDPGHHVEVLVVERVCQVLQAKWGNEIPILASHTDTNPFRFI